MKQPRGDNLAGDRSSIRSANGGSLLRILSENCQDTETYYKAIREQATPTGVFWDSELAAWVITRYDLCRTLLGSEMLSKSRVRLKDLGLPSEMAEITDRAQAVINEQMIFGELQAEKRAHVNWEQAVRSWQGTSFPVALSKIADDLINQFGHCGEADLYTDLLRPFVSMAISTRLGLSEAQRNRLFPLISSYADFLDGKTNTAAAACDAIFSLLLLHDFVATNFEGLQKNIIALDSRESWIANYVLTLVAGHESTAYALGTALLHLDATAASPPSSAGLHALFVEALRFDSPIQIIGRIARTDFELVKGITVDRDDKVLLHIGIANRDPAQFSCPDEFKVDRPIKQILSFGLGGSRCIGVSFTLREFWYPIGKVSVLA